MDVFVTGGTGFVGSHLVAALNERGITPRVLHRTTSSLAALTGLQYDPTIGDVLDSPEQLAEQIQGCDWVFHVSAVADYWRVGEELLFRVNVDGTQHMLTASRLAGVKRFVFTSSLASMGVPDKGELLTERHWFNLSPRRFPYGYSKVLAELEVRAAVRQGLEAMIVNPSIVLGPRDVNQISGSMITESARGNMRFLPPGGANFVAAEDVAAGHIAAAKRGVPGERYILGGENIPYAQATRVIHEVIGRKPPWLKLPGPLMPLLAVGVGAARRVAGNRIPIDANQVRMSASFVYADTMKAQRVLSLPQTPFRTTVERADVWYRENGYFDA